MSGQPLPTPIGDDECVGPLPHFLIIGAAKCGTTTLYEHLLRHPSVFMPELKEPEFFSRDEVFARTERWYRGLFAGAGEHQVCGEASTTYTRWPHTADAPARIAEMLPGVRLIYIMRNPVDRAYSHYAHHMRLEVSMTFEEALSRSDIYVDCGLYMDQLERYFRHFERDRVLPLLLEDLRDQPESVLERVQRHIGVAPAPLGATPLVANPGGADQFLRRRVLRPIKRMPIMGRLVWSAPKSMRSNAFAAFRRSVIGRRLERSHKVPPMLAETRRRLIDRFAEPNARLAEYVGRDLSHWSR